MKKSFLSKVDEFKKKLEFETNEKKIEKDRILNEELYD